MRNDPTPAVRTAYRTVLGEMLLGKAEAFLTDDVVDAYAGRVQLLFTSPPYPLNRKKRYGNLQGQEYVEWLAAFAPAFKRLLTPDGSIVVELGNAWEPGKPAMSVLALKALLSFLEEGALELCQQFVCYNPARLPTPAQWVTVERIRVKDAYTNVWWMGAHARPKADNRRVLKAYSAAMKGLLARGHYNAGKRPSQHSVSASSFLKDNDGAIPPNVLTFANTRSTNDPYQSYCRTHRLQPHPARMPHELAEFFIRFLTDPGDLVFDPFGGSNTTGAAAERLGRRWVVVEPTIEYIRGSMGRFEGVAEWMLPEEAGDGLD